MKQEMMGGSGISWTIHKSFASRFKEITTPVPHLSVITGRMPFQPPNQQRQSTENIHLSRDYNYLPRGTAFNNSSSLSISTVSGALITEHSPALSVRRMVCIMYCGETADWIWISFGVVRLVEV